MPLVPNNSPIKSIVRQQSFEAATLEALDTAVNAFLEDKNEDPDFSYSLNPLPPVMDFANSKYGQTVVYAYSATVEPEP